jgi:hypothetical protein
MNDNKEEQKAAELAVVKKISSEIPNLIHDAEERTWAKVLEKDHYETYAVESPQMRKYLKGCTTAEREFKVTALRNHVLAYDNLSQLSQKVFDALCRQATGVSSELSRKSFVIARKTGRGAAAQHRGPIQERAFLALL